jgi:hypothetical protein
VDAPTLINLPVVGHLNPLGPACPPAGIANAVAMATHPHDLTLPTPTVRLVLVIAATSSAAFDAARPTKIQPS